MMNVFKPIFLVLLVGLISISCHNKQFSLSTPVNGKLILENGTPLPKHHATLWLKITYDDYGLHEKSIKIGSVTSDNEGRFTTKISRPVVITKVKWSNLSHITLFEYELFLELGSNIYAATTYDGEKPSIDGDGNITNASGENSIAVTFTTNETSLGVANVIKRSRHANSQMIGDTILRRFFLEHLNNSELSTNHAILLSKENNNTSNADTILMDYAWARDNNLPTQDIIRLGKAASNQSIRDTILNLVPTEHSND
jgi:hypothetical protein